MLQAKVVEKIRIHIFTFHEFFSETFAVCAIMFENMVGPNTPQMLIWRECALHAGLENM
jgi:hypothetical protein